MSSTFLNKINAISSSAGEASMNLGVGSAPTTPVNGDVWATAAGVYAYINGAIVGPLGASAGSGSSSSPAARNAIQSALMDVNTNEKTAFLTASLYTDITPNMTADNAPAPYVALASTELASHLAFDAFYPPPAAGSHSWVTGSNVVTGFLQLDFGVGNAQIISKYSLMSFDTAGAQPQNWTFLASNTGVFGGEQVTLDTQTGITTWSAAGGAENSYPITNSTAYRYYRINVTLNNGSTIQVCINRMGLYTSSGGSSNTAVDLKTSAGAYPLVMSFANGLNTDGSFLNLYDNLNADVNGYWTGLTSNTTNYLFISRNPTSGALSPVVRLYPQVYSTVQLLIAGITSNTYAVGSSPTAIAVDSSGNAWSANYNSNNVTKLSPAGVTLGTYTVGTQPRGIAIDSLGNVWVSNQGSGSDGVMSPAAPWTVTKLSNAGVLIGTYNVGTSPGGIAIDSSDNMWVANLGDNTVTVLSNTGVLLGTYTVGSGPQNIAIDSSGNAWVTNQSSNNVTKLSSAGVLVGSYATGTNPSGIAIDSSGNVWVANYGSANMTKLSSTGALIATYIVGSNPTDVAINNGNAWVTNYSNNNVMELSPTGTILNTYAVGSAPFGIAFDSSGDAWVANYGSANATKLSPSGIGTGYFNPTQNKAFVYSGSAWTQEQCIPIGELVTNVNGQISSFIAYSTLKRFSSGAKSCAPSATYLVSHNIGDVNVVVEVSTSADNITFTPLVPTSITRNAVNFTTPVGAAYYLVTARHVLV